MPITLDTPIAGPVIAKKEVVGFHIDLLAGTLALQFSDMTAEGEVVGSSGAGCSLYTPAGTPRFTGEEYASIKAAVYRLALESGLVAGTVV